jgi:hypothetical protein
MRRAGNQRASAAIETPVQTSGLPYSITNPLYDTVADQSSADDCETVVILTPAGFTGLPPVSEDRRDDRRRNLAIAIRQRIESRLLGRIRDLNVRIQGKTIVLEGRCATYYTKQLAQHAALGVLEDEQLENAIVVTM